MMKNIDVKDMMALIEPDEPVANEPIETDAQLTDIPADMPQATPAVAENISGTTTDAENSVNMENTDKSAEVNAELSSEADDKAADETGDETSEQASINIQFQPENLSKTLPMMGKGMLGIFVVIAVIIAIVYALNSITNPKDKSEN